LWVPSGGKSETRWVPFEGVVIKPSVQGSQKMQARRQNDVRLKTAATLARAQASSRSAQNVRQMMEEKHRKIAAMSHQERQQLQEQTMRRMTENVAKIQSERSNRPVRGNVMNAPMRGLTHNAHTAGRLPPRQAPSNATATHRPPIISEVAKQHHALQSSDEMREASSAVMQQHGWTKMPSDPQAITLFREQVDRIIDSKQRSRQSRRRRREKRAHYRQERSAQAAQTAHNSRDY
jgi:hypothetical protein